MEGIHPRFHGVQPEPLRREQRLGRPRRLVVLHRHVPLHRPAHQLSRLWLDPDPENESTYIHVLRAVQNFTPDLFIRVFFRTNSAIDRKNVQAVFVWRYKPPFGTIQLAYERGTAAFGERSQQGNTFFVKFSYVI